MDIKRLKLIRDLKATKGFGEVIDYAFNLETVVVGKNLKMKPYTVIGTDGFGYERNEKGKLEKFPHYGKVIIGNDVDIGAFVAIDRGNLDNTVIGDGTKIDNLVHIGHNAQVGKNCLIVAGCVLGGSCKIGDNCFLGENVSIAPHIVLGDNCLIGMGSVVLKDVPKNETWVGNPARKLKDNA